MGSKRMKDSTDIAIPVCIAIILILLTLLITGCTEKEEYKPMSRETQCVLYGKWCQWPVCGGCDGDEPRVVQ